jgi:RNA polymerase sigma-70 factor (ECF subfamily)
MFKMTRQFVKAAQAGDNIAWNVLYRQHYPWMYAIAIRLLGHDEVAKDAVQETFVAAYLKLRQLKDIDAFAGWLKAILTRFCHKLKQQQTCRAGDSMLLGNNCFFEDEINRKIDEYSRYSKIYSSLFSLSNALRSVVMLRYFSNSCTYEEIAAILCIPVGTVRSRLNEAKKKLAEHWAISNNDSDMAFREAAEWNGLYNEYFGNVYTSLSCREKLIEHFDKNLQIIFTSGKTASGRNLVQKMIEEDMQYGNSLAGLEVISCSNTSIVEFYNINSDKYPDRCPTRSVFVLQRTGDTITRFSLHHSR